MKKICLLWLWISSACAMAQSPCEPERCWFASGEFIYWKPHEDNLFFALDGVGVANSGGSSKELDWKWCSGFKVGLGSALPCCTVDGYLNYTWYHGKATGSASQQNDATPLFPTFAPDAIVAFPLLSALSEWTLHYHTLDLEWGDWFCLNNCFLFHPNIGLRAAFTREKDHFEYTFDTRGLLFYNYQQSFNGVGPRIGLNTCWNFCNCFSLFGDGALALVWGEYHVKFIQTNPLVDAIISDSRHRFDTVRALLDLRLGLEWNIPWCQTHHCALAVAWEHRVWLKHNQFLRYSFDIPAAERDNNGDLSLSGLDFRLKFSY